MQHRSARPGRGCRACWLATPRGATDRAVDGRLPIGDGRASRTSRRLARGVSARVEYLIRPARITDIERLVALARRLASGRPRRGGSMDSARPAPTAGLPARRRASSSPRPGARSSEARSSPSARPSAPAASSAPSTSLVVDPDHDADRVTDALLEEILRSARNKGCSDRRGRPSRRSGGADPPGASWVRRSRSAR